MKSRRKKHVFDLVFKISPIFDHVAKLNGDRPTDREDLALNKEKKETAAKHKGSRVALSQRAALIIVQVQNNSNIEIIKQRKE